jgi:predicted lipoprotein with Yx(FWY)xxD motif
MKAPLVLSLLTAATLTACSSMKGPAAPAMAEGGVLVTPAGMSLYTFDADPAGGGKSTCNGPCADNWPPLVASAAAKPAGAEWSMVKRDDGREQWAYKGKPLYQWSKDQKPGDKTGDGFKGVWHLAQP